MEVGVGILENSPVCLYRVGAIVREEVLDVFLYLVRKSLLSYYFLLRSGLYVVHADNVTASDILTKVSEVINVGNLIAVCILGSLRDDSK